MPFCKFVTYLLTYHPFKDYENKVLTKLANEVHELRMLSLPNGLIAQELIEVIDAERIMPGITRINKQAEDFPYLNLFNNNNNKQ